MRTAKKEALKPFMPFTEKAENLALAAAASCARRVLAAAAAFSVPNARNEKNERGQEKGEGGKTLLSSPLTSHPSFSSGHHGGNRLRQDDGHENSGRPRHPD